MSDTALYRELAHRLQVAPDTIRTWLAEGTLDVLLFSDNPPWIHCFPARSRITHILRDSKKRHSGQLQAGQRSRTCKG